MLYLAKAIECKMRRHYYDLMDDKAPLVIVKVAEAVASWSDEHLKTHIGAPLCPAVHSARNSNNWVQLKVSKFQNEFMMSSFLPKNKQKILRISALAFKKCSNQKTLLYNYVKLVI